MSSLLFSLSRYELARATCRICWLATNPCIWVIHTHSIYSAKGKVRRDFRQQTVDTEYWPVNFTLRASNHKALSYYSMDIRPADTSLSSRILLPGGHSA
jgi:hypothetical protein